MHPCQRVREEPAASVRRKDAMGEYQRSKLEEIMSAIDRCPSGALTYKRVRSTADAQKPFAEIMAMKNGPL